MSGCPPLEATRGGAVKAGASADHHAAGAAPGGGAGATCVHRVAARTGARTAIVTTRPCCVPPQTIFDVGLIGGGQVPMPGEVSLAHHGMLFLDELPECRRHVLEVLRQPLEERLIYI
jgi:predicted ATPase with chaperone activity